jgi:hypothetical protein
VHVAYNTCMNTRKNTTYSRFKAETLTKRIKNLAKKKYAMYYFEFTPKDKWDLMFAEILQTALRNNKPVLIVYVDNPIGADRAYFLKLCNILKESGISAKVLTSNIHDLFTNDDFFVYFPTFWDIIEYGTSAHAIKKFRFSGLSSRGSFHRVYFFNKIKDIITDADLFSIRDVTVDEWEYKFMKSNLGYVDKSIENFAPFMSKALVNHDLHTRFVDGIVSSNKSNNSHLAYSACFNIPGETSIDAKEGFITEKTWKVITAGSLPLYYETPEYGTILERLGFRVHNEINVKDLKFDDKINHIIKCMQTYSFDDIHDIYQHHIDDTHHNIETFYSTELKELFTNHVMDKLKL